MLPVAQGIDHALPAYDAEALLFEIGRKLAAQAGERLINFSAELGGKNPMVVTADADVDEVATWTPVPSPGDGVLVLDALMTIATDPLELVRRSGRLANALERATRGLVGAATLSVLRPGGGLSEMFRTARPRGSRVGLASFPLSEAREIARAHSCKVNDVVLAVLCGALRSWILSCGHPLSTSDSLRAIVPMAVTAEADGADADWIVAALLHDIGDELAPHNHDSIAADIVLIGVKPVMVPDLLREIAPVLRPGVIVVSLAAGVTLATFASIVGDDVAVVRSMPGIAGAPSIPGTAGCPVWASMFQPSGPRDAPITGMVGPGGAGAGAGGRGSGGAGGWAWATAAKTTAAPAARNAAGACRITPVIRTS